MDEQVAVVDIVRDPIAELSDWIATRTRVYLFQALCIRIGATRLGWTWATRGVLDELRNGLASRRSSDHTAWSHHQWSVRARRDARRHESRGPP